MRCWYGSRPLKLLRFVRAQEGQGLIRLRNPFAPAAIKQAALVVLQKRFHNAMESDEHLTLLQMRRYREFG